MPQADQAKQRRYQLFRDQHNREWGTVVEISTGHPLGSWSPRFAAPIRPAPKYLTIDDTRPGRLRIRYEDWIKDLTEARRAYIEKGKRYGFEKYGAMFDPGKPFTEEILLYTGPPPKPVEPVLAAKQGNRWILGLLGPNGETPLMPEKLAPFFVKPDVTEEAFGDEYLEPAESFDDDPPAATTTQVVYQTAKARTVASVPVKGGMSEEHKRKMAAGRARARAARQAKGESQGWPDAKE